MRSISISRILVLLTPAALLGACQTMSPTSAVAFAPLQDAEEAAVGEATISQIGDSLRLSVTAKGLTPGPHGIHLHTAGVCAGPDFTTAGGHLNPGNRNHGSASPSGPHLGDLPNLQASAQGIATLDVALPADASVLLPALFDSDGTAIVIHSEADDYRSDPSGKSGARIACGILTRAR